MPCHSHTNTSLTFVSLFCCIFSRFPSAYTNPTYPSNISVVKPPHWSRIHSAHNLAPSLQIILFIYPDVRLSSSVHELLNTRWAVDHGKTLVGLSSDKWIWQCPGRLILPVLAAWRCGFFWLAATANRLATARQNSEHFLMNWVIKKKKKKQRAD